MYFYFCLKEGTTYHFCMKLLRWCWSFIGLILQNNSLTLKFCFRLLRPANKISNLYKQRKELKFFSLLITSRNLLKVRKISDRNKNFLSAYGFQILTIKIWLLLCSYFLHPLQLDLFSKKSKSHLFHFLFNFLTYNLTM